MRLIDGDALKRVLNIKPEDWNTPDERWRPESEFGKVIDAMPVTEVEPKWISCSERLPEESGDYLLYRPHFWGANRGQITVCYFNGREWSDNYRNDAERYLQVVAGMAWMPLPEPYKGVEE